MEPLTPEPVGSVCWACEDMFAIVCGCCLNVVDGEEMVEVNRIDNLRMSS